MNVTLQKADTNAYANWNFFFIIETWEQGYTGTVEVPDTTGVTELVWVPQVAQPQQLKTPHELVTLWSSFVGRQWSNSCYPSQIAYLALSAAL